MTAATSMTVRSGAVHGMFRTVTIWAGNSVGRWTSQPVGRFETTRGTMMACRPGGSVIRHNHAADWWDATAAGPTANSAAMRCCSGHGLELASRNVLGLSCSHSPVVSRFLRTWLLTPMAYSCDRLITPNWSRKRRPSSRVTNACTLGSYLIVFRSVSYLYISESRAFLGVVRLAWCSRMDVWARSAPRNGNTAEMGKPRRDRAGFGLVQCRERQTTRMCGQGGHGG